MIKKMRLVFKSLREYKVFALITPLFMIGEAAMECALPFVMSKLTDEIQVAEPNIWPFVWLMIGGALISLVCGILGGVFASKAATGLAKNLRYDLYKKVQSFSFANIDKFSVSSLVTRMTTDINTIQMAFGLIIRAVFRAPLMMAFSIIMAFVTGGPMAWIFIGMVPLVAIIFIVIIAKAMPTFTRLFKRYDKMNESVQENIAGIRVVKTFVREEYEKEKFRNTSSDLAKDFIKAEKIVAWNNPALNFAIHFSNMLICTFGSWLIYENSEVGPDGKIIFNNLSLGGLSALQTYGVQILMSLMFVSMILVMLAMSIEAFKRVYEVLIEEPTIENPKNPIYEVNDGSITLNNVSFKYNEHAERNALENINISINSGEFVGIIGSTGSGKTTLINLISRLYDVSEGEVIVSGHNVREYDLEILRDSISVVLQKNELFSGSIADNLRWGDLNASLEDVRKAAQTAQIDDFVMSLKHQYDNMIKPGGNNVSGGQKQRLCIARALLKKPKILILDDSTSAVDTKTDKMIQESLRRDIPHTTKIVIAQRISSIEDADKIIVMDDGKINAIGTHEELLKNNEIYREVYNTQTKKGGK